MTGKVNEEDWENLTLDQKLNVLRNKVDEMANIIQKIVEDMYVDEEDCDGEDETPVRGKVRTPVSKELQELKYIT